MVINQYTFFVDSDTIMNDTLDIPALLISVTYYSRE